MLMAEDTDVSFCCRTTRLQSSFIPQAPERILNNNTQHSVNMDLAGLKDS